MTKNHISIRFFKWSVLYLVLVGLLGVVASIQLAVPGSLSFGTVNFTSVKSAHVNLVIFGWATLTLMGFIYYLVPKLLNTELYSQRLAEVQLLLTNIGGVAIVLTLLAGLTQGREYAEAIYPLDFAVVLVWVLFAYNIFMTVFKAKFSGEVHPSLKFLLVSVLYLGVNYLIGMIPFAPGSVQDELALWTFAHNAVNGWFAVGLFGILYYITPRLVGKESIYSGKLSNWHFWLLMLLVPPSALHHLLYAGTRVSNFWYMVGLWTSVSMFVPTVIFVYLMYKTIKSGKIESFSPSLKYVIASVVFYLLNCIQGFTSGFPASQKIIHGTNYVVGHAHLATLAFFSVGLIGGLYYLIPYLVKREQPSTSLDNAGFWSIILGFLAMLASLLAAGWIQGSMRMAGESYANIAAAISLYLYIRLFSGIVITLGFIMVAYSFYRTIAASRKIQNSYGTFTVK
ncbi:MAG: cbb3-type cytochrome c oxidase subunit I [Bacillota bacterium]